MKHRCIISTALVAALALIFQSCQLTDATRDYGFAKIYIPQATVTGLDNSYPVPGGPIGQNSTYNCYVRDGKLNIALGVVRSGYMSVQKAFSVTLSKSQSETDRKLQEYSESGTPAMELPAGTYTVPSSIDVMEGKNTGTCYASIDLNALAALRQDLFVDGRYKYLALGLEISDPTEYELSDKNTSVVIVLDLGSKHWDNLSDDLPESAVRELFPTE